ncbi:unnamed protein product [Fusarium graminearum]|uniref:Uncharacterized protein n=1 Tax=Gibberella zeae TaxID=5518 RepID=A0A4E9EE00_GIBZA|nr:unnamed protein product [Fusarium graminearum]CAF3619656.1 unnamed protein product [Fusarium graminearum]CAG1963229.1 unnamed protein product [Fusarium graminearum]CAG1992300.1 unnamed protein product [Fusarium graminearum]
MYSLESRADREITGDKSKRSVIPSIRDSGGGQAIDRGGPVSQHFGSSRKIRKFRRIWNGFPSYSGLQIRRQ